MKNGRVLWFTGLFAFMLIAFSCVTEPPPVPPGEQTFIEVEYHSPEGDRFLFVAGQIRGFASNAARQRELVIPNSILGDPVTSIGNNAFRKANITKVTIPSSVRSIGSGAFADNPLTDLIIHKGVTHIDDEAFLGNKLFRITIPESVDYIGKWAFHREAEDFPLPSFGQKVLAVITIGADVEMAENPFSINLLRRSNDGFSSYYKKNDSRAGIYYLVFASGGFSAAGNWSFAP